MRRYAGYLAARAGTATTCRRAATDGPTSHDTPRGDVPAVSWADPTPEDLAREVEALYAAKEEHNPVECSLGLLSASMLGELDLYEEGVELMCADLGVEPIAKLDHTTCTGSDLWQCIHESTTSFKLHPGGADIRAWMLGRLCIACTNMEDDSRASAAAHTLHEVLLEKKSFNSPEVWALGYLLQYRGRKTRNSRQQIDTSPGGVQQARSAFGRDADTMTKVVKTVPAEEFADSIWAKTMLLAAACDSGATEYWSRQAWCNEAVRLPTSDYKGWALALVSGAAAAAQQRDTAALFADRAMELIRQHPRSALAPHDAMLTILTLRSSFVDLHRVDPGFSKKVAKRCCPNLPFVERGFPPSLLGVPRFAAFPLKESLEVLMPDRFRARDTMAMLSSL